MTKVLPVLALLLFVVGITFGIFKVKVIEVAQNSCLVQDNSDWQKILLDKSIFHLEKEQLEKTLKAQFPCLEGLVINRQLPSTIQVLPTVKEPVVRLSDSLAVTDQGLIIESNKDLPTLTFPNNQTPKVTERLTDSSILFTLSLAKALAKSDFQVINLRILESTNVIAYDREGTIALFSKDKSASEQVDSLQDVIALAKIDATKIAKIDLRFDKPVIVYKNNGQR